MRIPELEGPIDTLDYICDSLWNIYLGILNAKKRGAVNGNPHTKKIEKKVKKLQAILDCLANSQYLYILNIEGMAEKELETLKRTSKNSGFGEYHFISSDDLKKIISHLKTQKAAKLPSSKILIDTFKSIKCQTAMFFSNDFIGNTINFIEKFETLPQFVVFRGQTITKNITLPAKELYSNQMHHTSLFQNINLSYEMNKGTFYSKHDLTLRKGDKLNRWQVEFTQAMQSIHPTLRFLGKKTIKILHIFANGVMVPPQTFNNFNSTNEAIINSFHRALGMIRAIQAATDQKETDSRDIYHAQRRSVRGVAGLHRVE